MKQKRGKTDLVSWIAFEDDTLGRISVDKGQVFPSLGCLDILSVSGKLRAIQQAGVYNIQSVKSL